MSITGTATQNDNHNRVSNMTNNTVRMVARMLAGASLVAVPVYMVLRSALSLGVL